MRLPFTLRSEAIERSLPRFAEDPVDPPLDRKMPMPPKAMTNARPDDLILKDWELQKCLPLCQLGPKRFWIFCWRLQQLAACFQRTKIKQKTDARKAHYVLASQMFVFQFHSHLVQICPGRPDAKDVIFHWNAGNAMEALL